MVILLLNCQTFLSIFSGETFYLIKFILFYSGQTSVVGKLIEHGANVNTFNLKNETALIWASIGGM